MKILLLTQYWPGYEEVGELTGAHRDTYVAYHRSQGRDYAHRTQVGDYHPVNSVLLPKGFQRIRLIRDILDEEGAPNVVFWMGSDTVVLNKTIAVESLIMGRHYEQYDFFISADVHGLNSDSFIVRNTPWARTWLDYILKHAFRYAGDCWQEQRVMQHAWQQEGLVHKICLLPQSMLNSYLMDLYRPWVPEDCNGHVRKGDLLLHLPGVEKQQRLDIFRSQRVADLMVNPPA